TIENLQALQGRIHARNTQIPESKHNDTKSRDVPLQKSIRKTSSTGALADTENRGATSKRSHANSVSGYPPNETPYGFSGKVIDDSVTSLSISRNASALNLMVTKHPPTSLSAHP